MKMLQTRQRLLCTVAATALLIVLPASLVRAAEPNATAAPVAPDTVEVVVVTAEKRAESAQKIPVAISALDDEALKRSNIDSMRNIQNLVPSLQFGSVDGAALMSIRGISSLVLGPGGDPAVAVHLDGVYLARAQYQDAALYDIERVEVLRGPQGTVNGRNATGGAVNIITKKPTNEFGGYANVALGNYNSLKTSGAVGGPLIGDNLLWRVAWRSEDHKGYTPNRNTGERLDEANQFSARAQLLAKLGTDAEFLLSLDTDRANTSGYSQIVLGTVTGQALPGVLLGGNVATGRAVSANDPAYYKRQAYGASGHFKFNFDGFTFNSITGYRELRERVAADLDGTSFQFMQAFYTRDQWQLSQELNLVSNSESPLQWLFGLYYLKERQESDETYSFPSVGFDLSIGGPPVTDSYAAYGQASYALTDELKVTAGLRYTLDQKKAFEYSRIPQFAINGEANLRGNWAAWTPKVSVDYSPFDDTLLYASVSRGFRSGGFNIGGLQGTAFAPEVVWSYEAGFKHQFFDNRYALNMAVFQSDYSDLQVFQIRNLLATVDNAASATIRGAEVEFIALPGYGIRLDVVASYTDSEFDKFASVDAANPGLGLINLSGYQLPRAPKTKLNIGLQKQWDMDDSGIFTLRGEYHWTSRVYFSEFNDPLVSQPGVSVWNAMATYETSDGRYRLSAYADNITDETIYSNKLVGAALLGFNIISWPAPPRTFGVELGVKF